MTINYSMMMMMLMVVVVVGGGGYDDVEIILRKGHLKVGGLLVNVFEVGVDVAVDVGASVEEVHNQRVVVKYRV